VAVESHRAQETPKDRQGIQTKEQEGIMFEFLYTNFGIVTVEDGQIITVEFDESVRLAYKGKLMFGWKDGKGQIWDHSFVVDSISDEILWLREYNAQFAVPLSLNVEEEHHGFGFLPAITRVFKQEGSSYPVIEVDSYMLQIVPSILEKGE
jgi:hypothetical protein